MPGGVFSTAGAGVKTNLLFFTKGKKTPMTLAHFGFDKSGGIVDDSKVPASLTGDWLEDEAVKNEPFPTYAKMLANRDESRY